MLVVSYLTANIFLFSARGFNMATQLTLRAGTTPIEGAIGTFLVSLDQPAPAGGLLNKDV